MKALISVSTKQVFINAAIVISMCLLTSCTRKISFLTSPVVPAARGYVTIKKDKNKNNVIQLQITDLAEVQRLQPPRQTYVVWMVTGSDKEKNIGQINSSSSLLSKTLKASFETVSSIRPTKIFITAEDDGNIQFPSTQLVLSTDGF